MPAASRSGAARPAPARAYAIALRVCRASGEMAAVATHPDATLLAACAEYGRRRRRIDGLSRGRSRIFDAEQRARAYAALEEASKEPLATAVAARARTLEGHRARAAAFVLWDEGDLLRRARDAAMLEDRLLAAVLLDLIAG